MIRNNNDYVSYPLALALKKVGFDEPCHYGYSVKMRLEPELSFGEPKMVHSKALKNYNDNRKGTAKGLEFCSAVPLWHAQKWLRDKKNIDVLILNCACGYVWDVSKAGDERTRGTSLIQYDDKGDDPSSGCWLSYESALSAGIAAAVDYLLNNKDK